MEELLNILFSIGFVLIGSLAFHISALVSGQDIYRDLPTHESTLLSIVAGIVIFLFSPISFIIFQNPTIDYTYNYTYNYTDILVQILNFEVLLAFFGGAVGLGLIFGCVTILKARVNILDWFRDKSGMEFLIYSYGITWDDFLCSVKHKGEVSVQTDDGLFKGLLRIRSIRKEPKEIVLDKPKIKRYGREKEIGGEENAKLLITGSKIKTIIVPERSFKKHYESMGHISQAFYCQIIAIGLFFLSYSAYLTKNYMQSIDLTSLASFYDRLSLFFLVTTIFVLSFSVWVAQKDYYNWRSFLVLSPPIAFVPLFLSLLTVLLIIFDMKVSQALIFIFAMLFISPLYIRIINWLEKHKESILKDIFKEFSKAFDNRRLFLVLPQSKIFVGAFIVLVILFIISITQISPVHYMNRFISWLAILFSIFIKQISPVLPVLIVIAVFSLLYITICMCLKNPIKVCFDTINEYFEGDQNQKLLKEAIQKIYLQLSCNEKSQASISSIENKILEDYTNDEEKEKIKALIEELGKLKKSREYLKEEDFNIILEFKSHIEKN
jgi:hypothetical protein